MTHVVVIGGGFAGLSALRTLSRGGRDLQTTLIDQRDSNQFLPLLPDMIGRRIPGDFLKYPLAPEAERCSARYVRGAVQAVDHAQRVVTTTQGDMPYDYLVVASGAQTNFYNHPEFADHAYVVDSVEDTERIHARLLQDDFDTAVIVGGGYAGVEMASVLQRYYRTAGVEKKIVIVQKRETILQQLPERFIEYATENLRALGIDIVTNESVAAIDGAGVRLEGGASFDKAMVLWTAGTRTADFVQALPFEKNGQGRLKVNESLQVEERIYAAGNAAGFEHQGRLLRMGVQFSLMEGACAGRNIQARIGGQPPQPFRPVDLGHVVPMSNWKSCGEVLGVKTTGWLPTFLHYFMSVFRSYGARNRLGVLRALLAS